MSDRVKVEHIQSVKYTDVEQVLTDEFGDRFSGLPGQLPKKPEL